MYNTVKLLFIKSYFHSKHNRYYTYNTLKWLNPTGIPTDLVIYNSVIKEKVSFIINSSEFISWYICGPTVYNSAHIGHASSFIRFDIIRRILEKFLNKTVIQVMCVTDIDDKIIKKSQESNLDWKSLGSIYEKEFFADLNALNVTKPLIVAKATDFIPQMIQFIRCLIDKNMAYTASDGSVYFDTQNYGKCGKLQPNFVSRVSDDQSENLPAHKKCLADFALWKGAKPGEPYWDTPWGQGRPGWHIECSTIASEYFGNSIDIHSGGIDLLFPHHENEESQCCAFHSVDQWVNYWMHTGHLHVLSEGKMSKSLGNTISIREFLSSYSANLLRMICLKHNYKTNILYDEELIAYCSALCNKFIEFFNDCQSYVNGRYQSGDVDSVRLRQLLKESQIKIRNVLLDDFDTPTFLSVLSDLVTQTQTMINCKSGRRCTLSVAAVYSYVLDLLNSLGFSLTGRATAKLEGIQNADKFENVIENSLSFRSDIRDFALSLPAEQNNDALHLLKLCNNFREELRFQGVIIKDRKRKASITGSSDKLNKNK